MWILLIIFLKNVASSNIVGKVKLLNNMYSGIFCYLYHAD